MSGCLLLSTETYQGKITSMDMTQLLVFLVRFNITSQQMNWINYCNGNMFNLESPLSNHWYKFGMFMWYRTISMESEVKEYYVPWNQFSSVSCHHAFDALTECGYLQTWGRDPACWWNVQQQINIRVPQQLPKVTSLVLWHLREKWWRQDKMLGSPGLE